MKEEKIEKKGYLREQYRIFYNLDANKKSFHFHTHDFHKILVLLQGNVSYQIEGRQYDLKPMDLVLVKAGEIHRPVLLDSSPYERLVIYISPEYFQSLGEDFFYPFTLGHSLLRYQEDYAKRLYRVIQDLASSFQTEEFAQDLYRQAKFTELLVWMNRLVRSGASTLASSYRENPKITEIQNYIVEHLTEELSVDTIADHFCYSRSYLMHYFKDKTGMTIGHYISEKRLFSAIQKIRRGESIQTAYETTGFASYASFYHAFTQKYHCSPGSYNPEEV